MKINFLNTLSHENMTVYAKSDSISQGVDLYHEKELKTLFAHFSWPVFYGLIKNYIPEIEPGKYELFFDSILVDYIEINDNLFSGLPKLCCYYMQDGSSDCYAYIKEYKLKTVKRIEA